jgi:protein ImuB
VAKPLKVIHRNSGAPLPPAQNAAPPLVRTDTGKLWLAISLPDLSLAALNIGHHEPTAIVVEQHKDRLLVGVNTAASELGLTIGMKLNGALAMVPHLVIHARQQHREKILLEKIAAWCYRFTSLVNVVGDDAVVLEVGGSLRLFGGYASLKSKLMHAIRRFGVSAQSSIAPTPLAALWLSRNRGIDVVSMQELSARLGELPLGVLRWPEKKRVLLRQLGLSRLVDCLRLPRDGFGRRLGIEYLEEIDRALGRLPDPQGQHFLERRLNSRLDLDAEVMDIDFLLPPIEQLLQELAIKLRQFQQGVDQINFDLHHLHLKPSQVQLKFGQPEHEYERFRRVFEDRLQRLQLTSPVVAVSLRTGRLSDTALDSDELPMPGLDRIDSADAVLLLERLRARLGEDSVCGLCLVDEHRPEAAWDRVRDRHTAVGEVRPGWGGRRPLWLLNRPLSLVVTAEGPCYEGQLQLEQGPERIETGWWDGQGVARDYYIASSTTGSRLWIYRELLKQQSWYLHGIFS